MTTLSPRLRLPAMGLVAAFTLGLVAVALICSSPARAATSPCSDDLTSTPSGPATLSTAASPFGTVLVVGSGAYAGCSVYMLTSDQLHALTGAPFACSNDQNVLGEACDTGLWPAVLTNGAPIAGPGVNPALLGTVTRSDLPNLPPSQQVTYAGQPLYRFFLDKVPGDTQGANLDDPITSTSGIWYLLDPRLGTPATGQAHLQLETAPVGGTGPSQTVLAAVMNNDFAAFPGATFPVYTRHRNHGRGRDEHASHGRGHVCEGLCAVYRLPLLTSGSPVAGAGVDQHALGVVARPDGTQQVTYHGHRLYLFNNDAYIQGLAGTQGIYGAGTTTPWGVFHTIPPVS